MAIRYAPKGKKLPQGGQPAPKPSTLKRKDKRAPRKRPVRAAPPKNALVSLQPYSTTVEEIHKLNTFDEFRIAGFAILRRTVDAVMWFAELLWQGKQRLTPDEFEQLQRDFSVASTTAVQYITTAKSERIRKLRKEEADLPAAAHTLYLLASMDDDEYAAFLKVHKVTKELTTTEVRHFRTEWKTRQELAHLPKTTAAAQQQATEEAAHEATAPVEPGADEHEFADAPEVGEGSEAFQRNTEVAGGGYPLFNELGESFLEISEDSISESFIGIDAEEAEKRFDFAKRLLDHVTTLHNLISDLQFSITNQ
jgi:hypothetical protein